LAVNFKYKTLSAQSSVTISQQNVTNFFPPYSITFYDDVAFQFKRQLLDGYQIISNIVSDDQYPVTSNTEKQKYNEGLGSTDKTCYIKVLVHKSVQEDTVNSTSTVFVLCRSITFGQTQNFYYPLQCIEKNQSYTIYSSQINTQNETLGDYQDGVNYFSLAGTYNVELNISIKFSISNAASTSISQVSSATNSTIDSESQPQNYFQNVSLPFSDYFYSNDQALCFTQTELSLQTNVFSTTTSIYESGNANGFLLKLTFDSGYSVSNLSFFGLTVSNSSPGWSASDDTYFSLSLVMNDGTTTKIEPCFILLNTGTYYNLVFDLRNISYSGQFINYILVEGESLNSTVTSIYTISYLNFMQINTSVTTFAFKGLLNQEQNYVLNISNERIFLDTLTKNSIIKSSELFSNVESLLTIQDEIIYLIQTESASIELSESMLVKTLRGFVTAQALKSSDSLLFFNNYENIASIKVVPPKELTIVDLYENSDYYLNGFCVKNPIYISKFERLFLPENKRVIKNKSIKINQKNVFLEDSFGNFILSTSIELDPIRNNVITFDDKKISEVYFCVENFSDLIFISDTKTKMTKGINVIQTKISKNSRNLFFKSKDKIIIKKMMVKYGS